MEKYFLYARKSSEDEDRQIQSISDQIDIMSKKAKSMGIIITHIFTEEMSAKAPGRPVFNEMIQKIKKGEANKIIAWKLDRLSRNPIDSGVIQYMLQTGDLNKIITIDREYTDADAGLLYSVESGIGNQFILDLKKNVKRGMDSKIAKGIFCAMPPAGYVNNVIDKTIEVDPKRFNIIRKVWDSMLSGVYTVPQIHKKLNDEWGFRTRKMKKQGGNKLSISGLYSIFNNIFYTGDFMWKGQIKKGSHKAMITYEEFYRVQELLGEKGIHIRGKTKEFAFTGIIKCGECGCSISAEQKRKKILTTGETKDYIYYHCTKRKKGVKCSQKSITLENLEHKINYILSNIEILPKFKDWALEFLKEDFDYSIEVKKEIQDNLQNTLSTTERKIKKLTESFLNDLIDEDEYKIAKKQFKLDIGILREKINKLYIEKDESYDDTERVFNFIVSATTHFNHGSLQTKKEIFNALGQNWIFKNGQLYYTAFPWFKIIEEYKKENFIKNSSLELNKIGFNKGKTSVENSQKKIWLNAVQKVRISILKYGKKLYFPDFIK